MAPSTPPPPRRALFAALTTASTCRVVMSARMISIMNEMIVIRPSTAADFPAMVSIVNDAAQAYRGVIPADRWHDPYMPADELASEIAAGVTFWVAEQGGHVAG